MALTEDIVNSGKFELYNDFYELFKIPGKLCNESLLEYQFTDFGMEVVISFLLTTGLRSKVLVERLLSLDGHLLSRLRKSVIYSLNVVKWFVRKQRSS